MQMISASVGEGGGNKKCDAALVQVMLMQINESWSNDQPLGGNHAFAFKSLSRDFLDLALADANIANRIKTGFGIDDTATLNYKIVTLTQCQ